MALGEPLGVGGPFLAVDWGTTNLRAWRVEADGGHGAATELPLGVSRLARGEAAARFRDTVRPALGAEDLPAVIAGMVGSTLGWIEVPYVDCPADAASLGARLKAVEGERPSVLIVPGLRGPGVAGAPDVMRGEETQVIGWLAQDAARRRGRRVICHPGTHAKWVLVEDGRIVRFVTAMTGELFALLGRHSVLGAGLNPDERSEPGGGEPLDEAAFNLGVETAGDGSALAARLFTARARVVGGGGLERRSVRSYLSGLLVGADVAATPALLADNIADAPIELIGDRRLCGQYKRALDRRGRVAAISDGEAALLSGLADLFRHSRAMEARA